jgi:hypothetical protein
VELAALLAEAKSLLLSAQATDLGQSYRYQMDKAVVIYYQASLLSPKSPEVWLRLGRLAEIRSLWATDPQNQEELMEEARVHFLKAAYLGYNLAHPPKSQTKTILSSSADPFVADLLWASRLKKGEINNNELTLHYTFNDQNPLYHPGLWSDRRFILLAEPDPQKKDAWLAIFRKEFDVVWASMPIQALNQRPDPPILKKIDVLLAWTETLLFLSSGRDQIIAPQPPNNQPDPSRPVNPAPPTSPDNLTSPINLTSLVNQLRQQREPTESSREFNPVNLFNDALALYPRALNLPLNRSEMASFLTRLDQAEPFAPNPTQREALWAIRDQFFNRYLKVTNDAPEVWAAWGQDLYQRAESLADDRLWAELQARAASFYAKSVELSPQKDRALEQWAKTLELVAYYVAPNKNWLAPASQNLRRQKSLAQARDQYQKAWDLGQKLDNLKSLARVSVFLAFAAKERDLFLALFQKATALGHLAVRASDNPAGSWLTWAGRCLSFQDHNLAPEFQDYVIAEAFAAYNHYLSLNVAQIPSLIEMADGVWRIAAQYPEGQDQALSLLIDICRRLTKLAPAEPGYGFALGLTVFAQLANRPAWPDDPAVTSDLTAKKAFQEVLDAFLESLESLSVWRPNADSPPPAGQAQTYEPLRFLSSEVGQAWVYAPVATFQERLASALNRPVSRLLAMARPETLPPWHQLQLASFLRLAAASGYLPAEERMAYWRLALRFLRLAAAKEDNPDLGAILAEEGLILAELNLLNRAPDPGLLKEAQTLWQKAEKSAPGSSHYARARWAAWRGDREELKKALAHPPAWEDNLTWPSFQRALNDPAFRPYRAEPWLKAAWFGYGH